jgi:hypothetical protein
MLSPKPTNKVALLLDLREACFLGSGGKGLIAVSFCN